MKIAQVLASEVWGEITPDTIDRGLGGRETAMIRLAEQWAELGHEVTNFVPVNRAVRFYNGEGTGFHEYAPIQLAKPMLACFPYDASIAWEHATTFADERIKELQQVRLVEMQVAHFLYGQMDAAEEWSTGVVALSDWAAGFLVHSGLELKQNNLYVLPNGVAIERYPEKVIERKYKGGHGGVPSFCYSSSPDRGLIHVLNMWPRIRKIWPDAELYVGYGVERWTEPVRWVHNQSAQMAVEIEEGMKQDGIFNMGSIGQKQLATLQQNCSFWLYPCDPIQPTETGCITAVENLAAGNPSIISDADCLGDEFGDVTTCLEQPIDYDDYIEAIQELFEDNDLYKERVDQGREFAERRAWKEIAPQWIDLFEENRSLTL